LVLQSQHGETLWSLGNCKLVREQCLPVSTQDSYKALATEGKIRSYLQQISREHKQKNDIREKNTFSFRLTLDMVLLLFSSPSIFFSTLLFLKGEKGNLETCFSTRKTQEQNLTWPVSF